MTSRTYIIDSLFDSEARQLADALSARQVEENRPVGDGWTEVMVAASGARFEIAERTYALLTRDASQDVYDDGDGHLVIGGYAADVEWCQP